LKNGYTQTCSSWVVLSGVLSWTDSSADSDGAFVMAFPAKTTEAFYDGLHGTVRHFGGCPRHQWWMPQTGNKPPGCRLISFSERREPCPAGGLLSTPGNAEGLMESRDFWDKLAEEFRNLLRDHGQRDLSATVSEGGWVINEGDTPRFRSVFEDLATDAARGGDLVAADEGPVDAWLNRLRQGPHFRKVEGTPSVDNGVTRRSTDGGWMDCLCLASMDFCINLRKDAPHQESASEEPSPPIAEYLFQHKAEGWNIAYGGQAWSGKSRLKGLTLVQTLLGSPRTAFRSAALLGRELVGFPAHLEPPRSDVPPRAVSSADRQAGKLIVDARARREAGERRDKIKKDLNLGRVPEQDRAALTAEFLTICNYLKTGPAGQIRKENPDLERARRAAQNQYSRALKMLTKNHLDRLQEHLKKSIKGGNTYTYRPEPDVDWST
jgi:hypothetical protein